MTHDELGFEQEPGPSIWKALAVTLAILLAIGVLAAVVYLGAVDRISDQSQLALDEEGCVVDVDAPETLFVLVDQSDPIPQTEMNNLVDEVMERARSLPRSSRVVLVLVNEEEYGVPHEAFSRCTPNDFGRAPQQDQILREIFGGGSDPEEERADWAGAFGDDLKYALGALAEVNPSDTALITALVQLSRDHEFREAREKRLLIYSDMLENSDFIRLQTRDYPSIQDLERHFGVASIVAELEGVSVDVAYVPRPQYHAFQTPAHQGWWRDYFLTAGAANVTFAPELQSR